jgi:hypothetical protein
MLEKVPEFTIHADAPPDRKRLDARLTILETFRVPVTVVFWRKTGPPVLDKIPELLRNDVAPPVRSTLDALLKMPALLR